MRKILIIGNYGAGNLGDDAILGGILTDLKEIGFNGEIYVTCGSANTSEEIYKKIKKVSFAPSGLRSFFAFEKNRNLKKILKEIDFAIIGGGGLFVDQETWKAPYIWHKQASWCRKFKIPYLIYGQSFGPLNGFIAKYLAKKTTSKAKAIHVRDIASKNLLLSFGLQGIQVGLDPAFSYLKSLKRASEKNNYLLVSLRNWGNSSILQFKSLIQELQKKAEEHSLKLALISMDPGNLKEKQDFEDLQVEFLEPRSVDSAFEIISSANFFVAMRLHANIFALCAEIPLLSLSYSTKVRAFLESLNAENLLILDQTDWSEEKILQGVDMQISKKPQLQVEESLKANRAFLCEHALAHNLI